ncbi:hypothetical protein [Enterococcus pallens]|uniref:Uncharacterized protein n=1 Tax=Enterococcus pallens ATCC BAA-351 TaxID=1158607 RepID=R2SDT7_9ENTE|nr:hypothetical protein [Enterococcus pallens]EOH86314.1 hypothetical protein UAU_05236 [Enterococcus pallens ATCC BAA-351]EOU09465.1 hypothetical protein I588_05198 [Enterococcus pallens ATCC BAA-351]
MYVIFGTSKKKLGRLLPGKKRYSLTEADEQLKEFASTLSVRKKPNYVIIEIYDGEERIFRSEFLAGTDDSSNLRLLLLNLLETEFPDADEEEKSELLQRINQAYLAEQNVTNSHEKEYKEDPVPPLITIREKTSLISKATEDKETRELAPEELTGSVLFSPAVEENQVKPKTKKNRLPKKPACHFAGFFSRKKKWLVLAAVLFIVAGVGIPFFVTGSIGFNQKESYSELVKEGKYSQALKEYPEEEMNLVEQLYSQKESKELKRLADKYHSKMALFYWAFLNQKWSQVTEIKGITQDTTIQAMKGYAYLAQGKLEEAELINKVLENDTLSDQIKQAKKAVAYEKLRDQDIAAAEAINKEIKDSELTEDIQVAKSIVNLLKKYQSDKENTKLSESERKEAQSNFELWLSNLEQLGGKINDGK